MQRQRKQSQQKLFWEMLSGRQVGILYVDAKFRHLGRQNITFILVPWKTNLLPAMVNYLVPMVTNNLLNISIIVAGFTYRTHI